MHCRSLACAPVAEENCSRHIRRLPKFREWQKNQRADTSSGAAQRDVYTVEPDKYRPARADPVLSPGQGKNAPSAVLAKIQLLIKKRINSYKE